MGSINWPSKLGTPLALRRGIHPRAGPQRRHTLEAVAAFDTAAASSAVKRDEAR